MAFFGLTGLGSQSPFELTKETPLGAFSPQDWQDAFMQTARPGFTLHSESDEEVEAARQELTRASITFDQLPTLLQHLYHCPKGINNVPESATALVLDVLAEYEGNRQPISLSEFMQHAERISRRAEAEDAKASRYGYLKDGLKSREFVSNLDYRAAMAKHTRMTRDPRDKALLPMTDTQMLGWNKPTIITKRHPTKSCEETRYASAMVKAGVYYN
ncbi:hypothetical protein P43SY_010269 [Pythium insidiosum]|uniref:Uncharacterized protein n=1 Tax=Pythium insidiosum TaxID=114742 RepID=A0AAD5LSY9_PYTIN|nr:hypothetical protein P43SY_010269 [Pythium insidiosum]